MIIVMKMTRFLIAAFALSSLSSCGLIGSVLKIPASILKTAGRTVGVSGLTDAPAQPVTDEEEQKAQPLQSSDAE